MELEAVQNSGAKTEASIKNLPAIERAEILEKSGQLDNKSVRDKFFVSDQKVQEYQNSIMVDRASNGL